MVSWLGKHGAGVYPKEVGKARVHLSRDPIRCEKEHGVLRGINDGTQTALQVIELAVACGERLIRAFELAATYF